MKEPILKKCECEDVEAMFNAYVNGRLDVAERESVDAHISECEDCRQSYIKHELYLQSIANIEIPQVSDSQLSRLIEKACGEPAEADVLLPVETVKNPKGSKHWLSFFGGFAAASIIAFAIHLNIFDKPSVGDELSPDVAFFEMDTQELIVVLNVPSNMPGSKLELTLPEEVSVAGYEYLDVMDWVVDLKKGKNTFVLPLEVAPYAGFSESIKLQAAVKFGHQEKSFLLEIQAPEYAELGGGSA